MTERLRALAADVLMGTESAPDRRDIGTLALFAESEGIAALVASALASTCSDANLERAREQSVIRSLIMEQIVLEVLNALRQDESPSLLLKGVALAHWAYPSPHLRACGDLDILVPNRDTAERLAAKLVERGYVREQTSGELVAFELMCRKEVAPGWYVEVDIHWRLVNSVLFSDRFTFNELLAQSVAIPSLGCGALRLGTVHAFVHAAVHRSRNLSNGIDDSLKWLYDFVVLSRFMQACDWQKLVALAVERQIAGITLSALDASSSVFGIAWPPEVMETLGDAAKDEPLDPSRLGDWRYMQTQAFLSLGDWKARGKWLWQRLFPSRDYMAYLYGGNHRYPTLLLKRFLRASQKLGKN